MSCGTGTSKRDSVALEEVMESDAHEQVFMEKRWRQGVSIDIEHGIWYRYIE
jgi:hypothetical protein